MSTSSLERPQRYLQNHEEVDRTLNKPKSATYSALYVVFLHIYQLAHWKDHKDICKTMKK